APRARGLRRGADRTRRAEPARARRGAGGWPPDPARRPRLPAGAARAARGAPRGPARALHRVGRARARRGLAAGRGGAVRLRVIVCLLALGGCDRCGSAPTDKKPAEPAAPEAHADEPEHEELPKRVRMSRKVIESAKIRWAPVARERLDVVLDLPGEIAADPDRM